MPETVILHLTDLHFGSDGSQSEVDGRTIALESLLRVLGELEPQWRPTVVCITGDIAYRATKEDYEEANGWLNQLLHKLQLPPAALFLCPGNHDLDRRMTAVKRPILAEDADAALSFPLKPEVSRPFAAFEAFADALGVPRYALGEADSHLVGVRSYAGIKFLACNSAWFAFGDRDRGGLWVGLPLLRHLEAHGHLPPTAGPEAAGEVVVCLIHHPDDWLAEPELNAWGGRQNTRDWLCTRAHILLSGHTHAEVRRPDRIAGGALRFTGGATYAQANYGNVVSLFRLGHGSLERRVLKFEPGEVADPWIEAPRGPAFRLRVGLQAENRGPDLEKRRHALRQEAEGIIERKWLVVGGQTLPGELPTLRWRRLAANGHPITDPRGRLDQEVPLLDAARATRAVLLQGDMGCGKSTALAQLALTWMADDPAALATIATAAKLAECQDVSQLGLFVEELRKAEGRADHEGEDGESLQPSVLLGVDGLDEVPRSAAARIVRLLSNVLPRNPWLRVVTTGRAIEVAGLSPRDWTILEATPLSDAERLRVLAADGLGRGAATAAATTAARAVVRQIRESPQLGELASTALGLRLLARALRDSKLSAFSTADLLLMGALERLGAWDSKDQKATSTPAFEREFPTEQARLELYGRLVHELWNRPRGVLAVNAVLTQVLPDASQELRAEAATFFETRGFLGKKETEPFPLRPYSELAAGVGAALAWVDGRETWVGLDANSWRIFSYAVRIAQQRGDSELAQSKALENIDEFLQTPGYVPAGAYVVSESDNTVVAKRYIDQLGRCGPRPLTALVDDRRGSCGAIAQVIHLAESEGFDWFYDEYLDPCYPPALWGRAIVEEVFEAWLSLARSDLDAAITAKLTAMVEPYYRSGVGIISIVPLLAIVLPEAFLPRDRYWFAITQLRSDRFGVLAAEIVQRGLATDRELVLELLRSCAHRGYEDGAWAARLWLQSSPPLFPDEQTVRTSLKVRSNPLESSIGQEIEEATASTCGAGAWDALLRWWLADTDGVVAAEAASALMERGEKRLAILGPALLRGLSEGTRGRVREEAIGALIEAAGDAGVRWLVAQMLNVPRDKDYGVSGRWWALLLTSLRGRSDAAEHLGRCCRTLGGFTFSRHADLVLKVRAILDGEQGLICREVLGGLLESEDLRQRRGAALLLVVADPNGSFNAWDVLIRTTNDRLDMSDRDWPLFAIQLGIDRLTQLNVYSNLAKYTGVARSFALTLLYTAGYHLGEGVEQQLAADLLSGRVPIDVAYAIRRVFFQREPMREWLLSALKLRRGPEQVEAAVLLLQLHAEHLNPELMNLVRLVAVQRGGAYGELLAWVGVISRDAQVRDGILKLVAENPVYASFPLARFARVQAGHESWQSFLFSELIGESQSGSHAPELGISGRVFLDIGHANALPPVSG